MSTIEAMNVQKQLGSVRVVATSNQSGTYFNGATNNGVGATFTYATGALTIDSVAIAVNDFVLFAGQSSAFQNGIYQCTTAGATGVAAVLQRRGDFQCIEQIRGGLYTAVEAGTVNAGAIYVVVEPLPSAIGNPVVSGANNIVFASTALSGDGSFLQIANNLSDVASASTALANLGVHSAKYTNAGGSATTTITDARITATSVVVGNWISQANAAQVKTVAVSASTITVVSTADPGASVFAYIATAAAE